MGIAADSSTRKPSCVLKAMGTYVHALFLLIPETPVRVKHEYWVLERKEFS
jgi:hypothetical protein